MPATVEKLPGQPIAIVTYYGHITVDDARAVFAQVAGLLDRYGAPLYRVTQVDCDSAHASFDEVMMLTTLSGKGIRGSVTDADVLTVVVGEHLLIELYLDAMRQDAFGGVDIPQFTEIADAMNYIETQRRKDGAVGGV